LIKKQQNILPLNLMKERDELEGAMAASELDEPCDVSFSGTPLELTLRLKTWTVPLSLETANH
jgi:hypothetical protein